MCPRQWLTLSDGSILTRQEQFVLRQVAAGEIADLKQQFGEAEADRRLRARFLEELLTGELKGVEIHRHGIRIRHAVIEEPLDLKNAAISYVVSLPDCKFQEEVDFGDAHFQKHLFLIRVNFAKKANFHRVKVSRNLFFDKAVFHAKAEFGGTEIGGQLSGDGARFEGTEFESNFNPIKVGKSAWFRNAVFMGPVDFATADIGRQFNAKGALFGNTKGKANFSALKIGLDLIFRDALFHGPAEFVRSDINRRFIVNGAKFQSETDKIDFQRMQVGQDAYFQGCDFHGLASFVLIKIAGDFHLEPLLKSGLEMSTTFSGAVNFRGADIGGEFIAHKTHFLSHTWVNFEAMTVGRDFSATGAIFAGSVNFSAMQVKKNFYIDPFGRLKSAKTLFKGSANFTDLEVAGVFNADQAIFQSESVIFSGLKVGQGAFFIGTIFFGGLVLKEGQLTDLVIRGLHRLSVGGLPLEEIVLNRTRIEHRLTIENVEVKRFEARNLEVKGPAELKRLVIKDEADFRDAALHYLQIVEIDWPTPRDGHKKVYLDGLTYQSLTTRSEPHEAEKWPELLDWLGLSRFNTQNFQELDAFFQRGGLRKWADKVHIAGKRRELGKLSRWNPTRWLTRFFWGGLAGYGRKPGRTLWISLSLIILGAFILNPAEVLPPEFLNNLVGYQDNVAHLIALRLIVSLYSFVAAIPGWGGHLSLTSPEFHLFVYLWFQRICGWILIPIGLAALYTRIK